MAETDNSYLRLARMTPSEVMNEMGVVAEGLDEDHVQRSRTEHGSNILSDTEKHPIIKRLLTSFVNVFTALLILVSLFNYFLEPDLIFLTIIFILVLLSGTMTFVQETRSSRSAKSLKSMVTNTVRVVRNGQEVRIGSKELVVGDIILVDTGNVVPADLRILESNHLNVDQSPLTGESVTIHKTEESDQDAERYIDCMNILFMGTSITAGSARCVVVSVGDDTFIGKLATRIGGRRVKTEFDRRSNAIVNSLLRIMVVATVLIFIISFVKGIINDAPLLNNVVGSLAYAMALGSGLLPELLSTIISTNLAKGGMDMVKKKVIMKDSASIQNIGAMDVLCSDKTGTLTQNRISVVDCRDASGGSSRDLALMCALNSSLLTSGTNDIDRAIVEYSGDQGLDLSGFSLVADFPFSFERRKATVIVKKDDGQPLLISKGAVSEVLDISSAYEDASGQVIPMTEEARADMEKQSEGYSMQGIRVLAISYRHLDAKDSYDSSEERDLVFAGFVLFEDPVKPSAKRTIDEMREYGIAVKVLTGDNQHVARNVCANLGIPVDDYLIGSQIDAMTEEELRGRVEDVCLFARLSPCNKESVVKALRANGHTVGVMGDGTNDTPAMKAADVSICVDTGTDIAKDIAGMILMEQDLKVVKDGALDGRRIFANTMSYVKMTNMINLGYAVSLALACILFNFEPMGALMILVYNIFMDLACMAIPWDNVDEEFIRKPTVWDERRFRKLYITLAPVVTLTDIMTWSFFVFVLFPIFNPEFAAGLLNFTDYYGTQEEILFQTLWFIEQTWMQVWAIHIVRTNKIAFKESCASRPVLLGTFLCLVVCTLLPFTGDLWGVIAGTTCVPEIPWLFMIWLPIIAVVYLLLGETVKRKVITGRGISV